MSISTLIMDEAHAQQVLTAHEGLALSAQNAVKSTLERSILRVIDTYPFAYTLASCGLRADSSTGQDLIDKTDKILNLMIKLNESEATDWSPITNQLRQLLDPLPLDAPAFMPVVEYALGRMLLFCNLFDKSEELTIAFRHLHGRHLQSIEHHNGKTKHFGELLANWFTHSSSSLLEDSLEAYLSVISQEEVSAFRDAMGHAWIESFNDGEEDGEDHSDAVFVPLAKAAKLVGISDFLRTFIMQDLESLDDYLLAVFWLADLNQPNEAEKLARECLEKYKGRACGELLSFFADRLEEKGDLDGAANEYLKVLDNHACARALHEFSDFLDDHTDKLPTVQWHERAIELLKSKVGQLSGQEKTEYGSLLMESQLKFGKVQEAFADINEACDPFTLSRLLKTTQGRSLTFNQVFPQVSQQIEIELGKASGRDFELVQEFLLIVYRMVNSSQEKSEFKAYLKSLKERFHLKGKNATILRRVGL